MRRKALFIVARHLLILALICAYSFFIGCPVFRITGYRCPFCGMTRAHLAFFHGDLALAQGYHSLYFLGFPFLAGLAHLRVLKKRQFLFFAVLIFVIASAIAFIVRYGLLLAGVITA